MGFLGAPLGWIMYYIQLVIGNYGWTLVIFTILIKLALFPLQIKQQKSTAKMTAFQPKLKELERKHKNNKQKYQEEMMKLYEQEGYNPMSGCLPMVVQMVILFGIIEVVYKPLNYLLRVPSDLLASANTMVTQLLGKPSSSQELAIISMLQGGGDNASKMATVFSANPDILEKIMNFDMNFLGMNVGEIPQLGWNWLILIPILSGVTAFLTSWLSMKQQEKLGQSTNKQMKIMFYAMPLMSVWFAFSLPAGVGIYWIVSNVATLVQSWVLYKIYTPEKMAAMTDKNADKNRDKMKKKREKMAQMSQYQEYYQQKTGKKPPLTSKDSSQKTIEAQATEVEEMEPEIEQLSAKDKIALARKQLAEQFGDEYEDSDGDTK